MGQFLIPRYYATGDIVEALHTFLGLIEGKQYAVQAVGNCKKGITLRIDGAFQFASDFKYISSKGDNRSTRTGRLICTCGKGYASEDRDGEHYGQCRICFVRCMSRAEMTKRGISTRP